MSASSSAASSTLSRSSIAVAVLAALTTAYGTYYLYNTYSYRAETAALPETGLHRRNAVRRRRRRTASNDDPSSLFIDDQIENDGAGHLVARTLTDGETVVDDQPYPEDYGGWSEPQAPYQRSGQNIVQLLFRVSEDATRRNAYVHRGCACNSCGTVPIRGIRYRCANCADYDLCENCESQGVHYKAHIFYKIKVPAPAFGPRHVQPVWYTGDPSFVDFQLPKPISTKLSRETGFERPELDAYWEQWTYMANTDWRDDPDDIHLAMDRKTFERCLVPSGGYRHAAPNLIFDRMFAFYDTNKDDLIGFPEFLHGIAYRKKKDKWKKIFEGYDIDGDGYVDRKDFLRIFRSYYVLYRQMHRDMLAGMEDQTMGTNEAHRLVTSRQPLSSAFGIDGRWPRAPDPRTGEGKVMRPTGDEEIVDGKGVMNENGTDTGNREDVFRRNIPRVSRNRTDRDGYHRNSGYWEMMLNPPETIDQMPAVLRNLELIRGQVVDILQGNRESHADAAAEHEGSGSESEEEEDSSSAERKWPPTNIVIIDEDVEAVEGPGVAIADVPRASRRAVIAHATHREKAQRQIYERWQRRQFYTDEEEGALPPAGWKEEDDLLARAGLTGESSKTPPRPKLHSRSSSKVRFAEDMDDFDTRSNPSTSSRSVPERWGGMEIPDAEKDAGKEILFQVTQQAFNELLDPLFKEGEDLAIEAAATKADREKYQYLYNNDEFEEWALEREAREAQEQKKADSSSNPPRPVSTNPVWPAFPEVEVHEVRERSLGDLLAATGYEVETDDEGNDTTAPEDGSSRHTTERHTDTPPGSDDLDEGNPNTAQSTPPGSTPSESEASSPTYRDPTLPQFRPNFASSPVPHVLSNTHESIPPRPTNDFLPLTKEEQEAFKPGPVIAPSPEPGSAPTPAAAEVSMLKDRTYLLWKCDKAEEQAEMRGGWGRLNFKEFEARVKRCVKEGKGNQMDYLGSWIEFCIP